MKPAQSIRTKLLRSSLTVLSVSQVGLLAAMVWIIASLAVHHRDDRMAEIRSELMEKGRSLMASHSVALPRMAEDNAFLAVAELVSATVRRDLDVVYGIFMDENRQPWALADSGNPDGRVREARILDDSASLWAAGITEEGYRRLHGEEGEVLEFAAPILVDGERAGTIRFALSTDRMHEAIAKATRLSRQAMLRTIGSVLLVGLLAASLAFLISRRSATRLTRPIQDLQQEANAIAGGNYDRQVDLSGTDEIALLAADFDAMRRRVKEYTERLHEMVEEKVREIRDILDNVGQGLFTVTFEGHVNPDYAATTNGILGVGDVARCTVRDLFRLDEAAFGDWMDWLEMAHMRHGKMSWEKLARLCPVRELAIVGGSGGVRHIQVGYQPMLDGQGNPAKLMVLVQDVTESRRIEAVMRAEKEKHEEEVRGILGIVNNGAMVPKFLQDVEAKQARLLTACRGWGAGNPREEELEAALRDLHTLKGSAATYGFVALERAARRAELAAAALRTSEQQHPGGAGELLVILEGELRQAVDGAKGLARRLSGLGDDPSVPVPERKLRGMQDLARQIPQGGAVPWERLDGLLAACRTLDHVRLSVPGERYRSMITRLSARLGKAVEFHVRPEAMEVSPRVLAQLDEPLVHILRNSLDHGLEQRAERTAAGKPEAGRIELTLERKPEGLAVRVEDDGKGIDTAKVAERAVASGAASAELVAAMTDAEKARLILLPGLTTRERGDDLSGLGVGMDAVAAWATARGGSLDLSTLPGRGTRIDIRLPPDFDAQV